MFITVHTERGMFESKDLPLSEIEQHSLAELMVACASGKAEYLNLETDSGQVYLGKDLLKTAVFVVMK